MRRVMRGLHEGERVRAERTELGWRTEVKLRDCGEVLGAETGFYEGCDDGRWTAVGTYAKLAQAEKAAEALFKGTHVFRRPHRTCGGYVPGTLVPSSDAVAEIARLTAPRP